MLNAKELVDEHGNRSVKLPTLGDKINQPSGSEREQEEIEAKLHTVKDLLSIPLVSQRSQISEATWDAETGLALVHKPCGKYFEVMGHVRDDKIHLYPEEALFLLESNAMEVVLNKLPLSIQQAYDLMLGQNCSLDEYRTYAHFVRQGYKVVRHQGDLGITQYEGQIKLDQYRTKKRKKVKSEEASCKAPKIIVLDDEPGPGSLVNSVVDLEEDIVTIHDDDDEEEEGTDAKIAGNNESERGTLKFFKDLPNIFGLGNLVLKTPPTDLLPYRAWPNKKKYDVVINDQDGRSMASKVTSQNGRFINASRSETESPPSPFGSQPVDVAITALNRPFYQRYTPKHKGKRSKGRKVKHKSRWSDDLSVTIENEVPEVITLSDDDSEPSAVLLEGPLKTLWTGSCKPLLRPSDALTTRGVLNKLKLKSKGTVIADKCQAQKFQISYDVYNPSVHFRKSAPRLPNYRIIISNSEEKVPNLFDLQSTIGTISDTVPLLFAIVSQSDIAFYSPFPIDLPLDITMG